MKALIALGGLLLLASACKKPSTSAHPASVEGFFVPRTTSPELAIPNFQSRIDALEGKVAADHEPSRVAELVNQLLARAQILGQMRDYDEAETWVDHTPGDEHSAAVIHLMRAHVRAAMHRFDEAEKELDAAEKLRAPLKETLPLRGSILSARGQWDAATALRNAHPNAPPNILSQGADAVVLGELGHVEEADQLFQKSLREYPDVSPMPVSWIFFQQGLMHERQGDVEMARRLYATSHAVLPQYAPATGHLAQMLALQGKVNEARALLEPLVGASDDPEYKGQLAEVLAPTDAARAQKLKAEALAEYDALLKKHPDAFADHAARFLLRSDPARALPLALRNLGIRQTPEAYDLALDASLAAGDQGQACHVARDAKAHPHAPARLIQRADRVLQGC